MTTQEPIRPFVVDIPECAMDDLRRRLDRTRSAPDVPGAGWTRGVPAAYLSELARYWREDYDWRAAEAEINRHPQYTTEIDGATIHFLHVRSAVPGAIPLLLSHGWPGSFVEFLDVIGPLTAPETAGAPAFHLVIPSIPGYGFSTLPEPGWNAARIARAWITLMDRLGYDRYLTQGGDAGAGLSMEIARQAPEHVLGVHVNMLMTFGATGIEPDEGELAVLARMDRFARELSGYMKLQTTRPQTLAYALTDSPVGQLAWIVEKFKDWTDSRDVPEDAVDRDRLLTNVTLYWLTATAGTSAHFYAEGAEELADTAGGASVPPVPVPLGVAVFAHDILQPLRRVAERDLPTIVHWSEFPAGGHFAAMERPGDLVGDLRSFADLITLPQTAGAPR